MRVALGVWIYNHLADLGCRFEQFWLERRHRLDPPDEIVVCGYCQQPARRSPTGTISCSHCGSQYSYTSSTAAAA